MSAIATVGVFAEIRTVRDHRTLADAEASAIECGVDLSQPCFGRNDRGELITPAVPGDLFACIRVLEQVDPRYRILSTRALARLLDPFDGGAFPKLALLTTAGVHSGARYRSKRVSLAKAMLPNLDQLLEVILAALSDRSVVNPGAYLAKCFAGRTRLSSAGMPQLLGLTVDADRARRRCIDELLGVGAVLVRASALLADERQALLWRLLPLLRSGDYAGAGRVLGSLLGQRAVSGSTAETHAALCDRIGEVDPWLSTQLKCAVHAIAG